MTQSKGEAPTGVAPRIVIVGAGFAGLACAQALGGARVRVTVIDKHNYNLFTPLLYQVATAALSPAEIASPIRRLLSGDSNIDTMMAEVSGVDRDARQVLLTNGGSIPYDALVLATGSVYNYFGHEKWTALAPGLKTIDDARTIRARLLSAFEQAEICEDAEKRRAMLTTVIIGGGPTGVEISGLSRSFRA